ncbi:hypothetical protein AX16_003361 [Volvariella volvacea WC 439]|nr:hypothetical protein AX16_003361 [Volvariella volvacea WC 439]
MLDYPSAQDSLVHSALSWHHDSIFGLTHQSSCVICSDYVIHVTAASSQKHGTTIHEVVVQRHTQGDVPIHPRRCSRYDIPDGAESKKRVDETEYLHLVGRMTRYRRERDDALASLQRLQDEMKEMMRENERLRERVRRGGCTPLSPVGEQISDSPRGMVAADPEYRTHTHDPSYPIRPSEVHLRRVIGIHGGVTECHSSAAQPPLREHETADLDLSRSPVYSRGINSRINSFAQLQSDSAEVETDDSRIQPNSVVTTQSTQLIEALEDLSLSSFQYPSAPDSPPKIAPPSHTLAAPRRQYPDTTPSITTRPETSIPNPRTNVTIYVDASLWGIGFTCGKYWLSWPFKYSWNSDDRDNNWAELVAIEMGLRTIICAFKRSILLDVYSDNQGVLQSLKTGFSSNAQHKDALREIAGLMKAYDVVLNPIWIPSLENPADGPSRGRFGAKELVFPWSAAAPARLKPFVDAPVSPDDITDQHQ